MATPNQHPYLDLNGNHVVGGPLTGWIFSDLVRQHSCPKCGSSPGFHCQAPSGRETWPPHRARGTGTQHTAIIKAGTSTAAKTIKP